MRRRKLVILLAALIFGLAACAKPAEPSPVAVSSVLALSSEQSTPAQTPEGQEKPAEPEHEWTQEDIRRMYQNIQEPDWVFIDCLVTPDRANGCVGAALYWDGKRQPYRPESITQKSSADQVCGGFSIGQPMSGCFCG